MNRQLITLLLGAFGLLIVWRIVMHVPSPADSSSNPATIAAPTQGGIAGHAPVLSEPAISITQDVAAPRVIPLPEDPLLKTETQAKSEARPEPPARPAAARSGSITVAPGAGPTQSDAAKAGSGLKGLNPRTMDKTLAGNLARESLQLVGVEYDATAFWAQTVNDPDQPAEIRRNLIEDLNEDGFPDPKHITEADLPLIESRLNLIGRMSASPIDDVNAAALAEAEKDLLNMLAKLKQ